jgi:hypothetical protein
MVLSMIRYSKPGSSAIAASRRSQTPLAAQRLNRRQTLFQWPKAAGRSRHGAPVRTSHSTPSTNMRLSRPVEPGASGRPRIRPDIRAHCASLSTRRSIAPKATPEKPALNHSPAQRGTPSVHRT